MVSRLSRFAPMCCNVSRIVRLLDKRVVSSFCLSCSWSQVFRSFYHVVVLSRCHKSYTDHVCFLSFFIVCFFCFFQFFFVPFFVPFCGTDHVCFFAACIVCFFCFSVFLFRFEFFLPFLFNVFV